VPHRERWFRVATTAATAILAMAAMPPQFARAQTTLSAIPGLTNYQGSMGRAIDDLCPPIASPGNFGQSTPLGDLARRCTELKVPPGGTTLMREDPPGTPSVSSLGLTDPGLADVLGKLTSEEVTALGLAGIESLRNQLRLVTGRLATLRLAIQRTGLRADSGYQAVAIDGKLIPGERGGGASADAGLGGRLGLYMNGTGSFGDQDPTANVEGFDFWSAGTILGADWRFLENLVAGAAFTYSHTDVEFDSGLGDLTSNSYGIQLYSTAYFGNFYLDLYGGFNWNTYDTTRRIVYGTGPNPGPGLQPNVITVNRTARGNTDGQQYNFNAGAGYDFLFGAFSVTPLARLEFTGLHVDRYDETGADGLNLTVASQKLYSLVSALGAQVGYAFSVPFGVIVPQLAAEWRHEWVTNGSVAAKYTADPGSVFFNVPLEEPTRDYAALRFGVSAVFPRGWQAFLNYEVLLGLRDATYNNFVGGVRFEF
jgi:outer membrane lipase/esterase